MKISGFLQDKVLGEGSYGKVYKTRRIDDNQVYALKVIDLNKLSYREIEDTVNEIRLMASVTSPFILSFYEAFAAEDQKRLCIITEYARIGDLRHLIERRKLRNLPLQEEQIWQYLLEILEGLRILHSCGIVHRDLKSANILVSAPDLVKIGDLGIATVLHNHKSSLSKEMARTQIGTPLYLAPEVWKKCPYDQKCDMWSLGVLLYEMMTFSFPFLGRSQNDLQRRICAGAYDLPRLVERMYSKDLISVLRRLLNVNPIERPSCEDLLNMQCVKMHMDLLNPFLQFDLFRCQSTSEISYEGGRAKLLKTIHLPRSRYDIFGRKVVDLDNVRLPSQKYNKRPPAIVPIEERITMKKGVPSRLSIDLATLSTPDLKLIADRDWWSRNINCKMSSDNSNGSSNSDELCFKPQINDSPRKRDQLPLQLPSRKVPLPPQLPPMKNDNFNINFNAVVEKPKVSPRLIPSRYRNLYRPCVNRKYQDPRWKRKEMPIKILKKEPSMNNIFFAKQNEVPWWFGQELQPFPYQQRREAVNPRLRRYGKN